MKKYGRGIAYDHSEVAYPKGWNEKQSPDFALLANIIFRSFLTFLVYL